MSAKQANEHRRCGNCRFWFRENEDMLPEEEKPRITGVCMHQHMMSHSERRLPQHGQQCDGFEEKDND